MLRDKKQTRLTQEGPIRRVAESLNPALADVHPSVIQNVKNR